MGLHIINIKTLKGKINHAWNNYNYWNNINYIFFIMPPIKTNIYGDYKVCIKCKNHADVIEKGKDYCVECWFENVEGVKFKDVEKQIEEKEKW